MLAATDVGEVWGVGRRIAAQLKEGGVHTVPDLAHLDLGTMRQRWSVVLERTVRELQGQACKLMGALDVLNRRYGRGTVLVASSGLGGDSRCGGLKGTVTQHAPSSFNLLHARRRKYAQVSYAGLACKLSRNERSSERRKAGG